MISRNVRRSQYARSTCLYRQPVRFFSRSGLLLAGVPNPLRKEGSVKYADRAFVPVRVVREGDIFLRGGYTWQAISTPGIPAGHMCLSMKPSTKSPYRRGSYSEQKSPPIWACGVLSTMFWGNTYPAWKR